LVAALGIVLGVFAIHNHRPVALDLWPLPSGQVEVALFLLVLAAAFIGFLIGGAAAWWGGRSLRRLSRQRGSALSRTRRELEDVRKQLPAPAARG
jgi:uncharacterized integral membrane protein